MTVTHDTSCRCDIRFLFQENAQTYQSTLQPSVLCELGSKQDCVSGNFTIVDDVGVCGPQ